jgi:hypothetical protein
MNPTTKGVDDLRSWSADLPLHGKLTYLGDQEKPVPSVFFHLGVTTAGYETFIPHQSKGVRYSNDTLGNARHFAISKQEQAAILANLATITPGDPPPTPRWALVVVQIAPSGPRAIEWLLNDARARQVVNAITRALAPENEAGRLILSQVPLL